jgi:hypothetical protein
MTLWADKDCHLYIIPLNTYNTVEIRVWWTLGYVLGSRRIC